jgi:thiol-disulfide isomerase/thioredoxin
MKPGEELRQCLVCKETAPMSTWLSSSNVAQLIAIVLIFAMFIPGLIFIALFWGKFWCPNCKAIGKNKLVERQRVGTPVDNRRRCPHCAEYILIQAKICKHCGSQVAVAA